MLSPDAKAIWKTRAGSSLMAAMMGAKAPTEGDKATARELVKLSGDPVTAGDSAIRSGMAFDRASVRRIDKDGRLHVELTNISKAAVNGYLGSEIPGGESLGLEPGRIYQLLRDPEELEKAAHTFNGLPVLATEHIYVSAQAPQKDRVIGATGTDAVFEDPYLKNSMSIWDGKAIARIESEREREISCGYHYTPVMEPGNYKGTRYDGRMTNLIGNHVAIVEVGRAGPDVIVGDSQLKRNDAMSKPLSRHALLAMGALIGTVTPLLAADSKLNAKAILAGVTAANWHERKAGIAKAIKPLLAADADLADVVQLLDKLNPDGSTPDEKPSEKLTDAIDVDPAEDVLAMLRGKISDEDLAAVAAKIKELMTPAATDADPKEVPAAEANAADPGMADMTDEAKKPAMDSAAVKRLIDQAASDARKQAADATEAREAVRPYVGAVAMGLDSAEAIYRAALTLRNVKHAGIHASALRAVLEAQPKPGAKTADLANDSAKDDASLTARIPGLATISHA